MRVRRILSRCAIVATVAGVGLGVTAGAAQASPSTCAHWAAEANRYNGIGQYYTGLGNTLTATGFYGPARDAYDYAGIAFQWSGGYLGDFNRNCQVP